MRFHSTILVVLFLLLCELLYAFPKVSFGFNSGYISASYTNEVELFPTLESALESPENVLAVKISANSKKLAEIKKLVNLKYLYLDETFTADNFYLAKQGIESFFKLFGELPGLEYVSIYDSKLLPYLNHIKKIKGLKINKLDWNIFQNNIENYSNLEILIINDPLVTQLPNCIGRIISLKQLELNTIGVNSLPDIALLQNLIVFKASLGKIQKLPPTLVILKELRYFKIDGLVKFSKFPVELCELENLEELYIELRNASPIPDSIGKLLKLRKFYLYDCQSISKIPSTIGNLKKLEEIYLSDAKSSMDISSFALIDHPFKLILNRCDYGSFAKQLSEVKNLSTLVVSSTILPDEMKKILKYLPENKILKKDY